jgi:hypothetical protein
LRFLHTSSGDVRDLPPQDAHASGPVCSPESRRTSPRLCPDHIKVALAYIRFDRRITRIGGGSYWAIGSWYAQGDESVAHKTVLTQVEPGTALEGLITASQISPGVYSYVCQFDGYPSTRLPVDNVDELVTCAETLEVYGLKQASDLPDSGGTVSMTDIEIQTASGNLQLTWQVEPVTDGDFAASANVVSGISPGGQIDITYW